MGAPSLPHSSRRVNPLWLEQKLRVEARAKSGADWFFWIALLGMVNSLSHLAGSNWGFVFGLAVTQAVDAAAAGSGAFGKVFGLIVSAMAAGVLVMFGVYARQGFRWAFLAGMALYAADGLLWIAARFWPGVGFHLVLLLLVYTGLSAAIRLEKLNRASAAA
jgi:hypothetical protein